MQPPSLLVHRHPPIEPGFGSRVDCAGQLQRLARNDPRCRALRRWLPCSCQRNHRAFQGYLGALCGNDGRSFFRGIALQTVARCVDDSQMPTVRLGPRWIKSPTSNPHCAPSSSKRASSGSLRSASSRGRCEATAKSVGAAIQFLQSLCKPALYRLVVHLSVAPTKATIFRAVWL